MSPPHLPTKWAMLHDERARRQPPTTPHAPLPVLQATVFAVVGMVLGWR
ncbi:hypothetical protein [Streptomyces olivaceiscleroticus]